MPVGTTDLKKRCARTMETCQKLKNDMTLFGSLSRFVTSEKKVLDERGTRRAEHPPRAPATDSSSVPSKQPW